MLLKYFLQHHYYSDLKISLAAPKSSTGKAIIRRHSNRIFLCFCKDFMFEAYALKVLGLLRSYVLLCVSIKNFHSTVSRAVFINTSVCLERKVLLNEKWWEDKKNICLQFLSQKTNYTVRLWQFKPDSCNTVGGKEFPKTIK